MQRRLTGMGLATACAIVAQTAALAQSNRGAEEKFVRIVRTDTAPVIDGVLEQDIWSRAARLDDFHEVEPDEYDEPAEATEVYLFYDDTQSLCWGATAGQSAGRNHRADSEAGVGR